MLSVIIKAEAVCVVCDKVLVNTATFKSVSHRCQSRRTPSCCFAILIQVVKDKWVIPFPTTGDGVPSLNINPVPILIF